MNKYTAVSIMWCSWGIACIFCPIAVFGVVIIGIVTGIVLDD
jgi:hypothetical protein